MSAFVCVLDPFVSLWLWNKEDFMCIAHLGADLLICGQQFHTRWDRTWES